VGSEYFETDRLSGSRKGLVSEWVSEWMQYNQLYEFYWTSVCRSLEEENLVEMNRGKSVIFVTLEDIWLFQYCILKVTICIVFPAGIQNEHLWQILYRNAMINFK